MSENQVVRYTRSEQDIFQEFTEQNSPNDPDHILNCNDTGRQYIHPPFRTGLPTKFDGVEVYTIYKRKENGNAYGGQIFHEKRELRVYILRATVREQRRARVLKDGVATSASRAIGGHTMKRYRKEQKEFREDGTEPTFQGYKLKPNFPLLTYENAGKSELCFELTGKKGNTLREDIKFHTTHFIFGRWTTDIDRYDYYIELASFKFDVDRDFVTASGKMAKQFWDDQRAFKLKVEQEAELNSNGLIEITIPSIVDVTEDESAMSDNVSIPETVIGTESMLVNVSTDQIAEFNEEFSDDVHRLLAIEPTPSTEAEEVSIPKSKEFATTEEFSEFTVNDPSTEIFSEFTMASTAEVEATTEPTGIFLQGNVAQAVVADIIKADKERLEAINFSEELEYEIKIRTQANDVLKEENGEIRANRLTWKKRSFKMKKQAKHLQFLTSAALKVLEGAQEKLGMDRLMINFKVEGSVRKSVNASKIRKSENDCNKSIPCDTTQNNICDRCEFQFASSVAIYCLIEGMKELELNPVEFCDGKNAKIVEVSDEEEIPGEFELLEYVEASSGKRVKESHSFENVRQRRKFQTTSDEEFFSCDDEILRVDEVEIRSNGKKRSGKIRSKCANMDRGSLQVTPTTTDSEAEAEIDLALGKSLLQVRRSLKTREQQEARINADGDDSEVSE